MQANMPAKTVRETDLYEPVKRLLEGQGYTVKAEIGAADVVACRGDEPPVIVELKTGFSLALFHQAIERLKLCDTVYVAVPGSPANHKKQKHFVRTNIQKMKIKIIKMKTFKLKN